MQRSAYLPTIERHIQAYRSHDQAVMDRLLRMYQGRFWTHETGESESALLKTSVNLTFAIVETALSTLLPPNPQVTALARNATEEARIKATEAMVNYTFDAGNYREELGYLAQDAVIYGRGIAKTVWDSDLDIPITEAADVRSTFFDLTARRPRDIRYWIGTTLLSPEEFNERIDRGQYASWARGADPDTYPKWMLSDDVTGDRLRLRNFQRWHLVYEVYDMEAGRVVHLLHGFDKTLFEDDLIYCPYDILTLNNNGTDCRGLSEIALISPNQEEINNLLTYWLNIVRLCVPRGIYNPDDVDQSDMEKVVQSGAGTWNPLKVASGKPMDEVLGQFPMPAVPPDALALLEKVWNNVTIVSALAEAQRGQVTGARTATELALIEGQIRNRLRSRQNKIDALTQRVAEKHLLLIQKYKTSKEVLALTGEDGWKPVSPAALRGIKAAFKVVPYSPMESNRAVVQEQFKELLQYLGNHPEVDQRQLLKVLIEVFDHPALRKYDILKPEGEQQQQEQAVDPAAADPAVMAAAAQGAPGAVDPAAGAAPQDVAALYDAAGMAPPSAAMPPSQQIISDLQAASAARNSPVIVPPGVPPGVVLPK